MPATNELLQEGRYRISERVNETGNVYEAYDTVRNTNVVVREIPVKLNRVATTSQRESVQLAFANQAKALTEIDHESLLHVHDFFSEIDRQYLVMEAIEGESLAELLARSKKAFSVSQVTTWADELLDALGYLHGRKPAIIHRNVRPQNLKLHDSGKVKLLGVGVESGSDADNTAANQDNNDLRYSPMEQIWPGLDAASQKVITNNYDDRSERILKEPLDARSDIYSLGSTLYFLITGLEPVDPLERSIDILEGKLDPLREPSKVNSQIAPEISDVLMKALEIKRENRYDSATIMRQVLRSAIERVKEREEEEAQEEREAAEIIRMAAQAKSDPAVAQAEQERQEAEIEQQRKNELMQKQLLEAEEQRLMAERQAAEAEVERLLREEEAAKAATVATVAVEDLLEIPAGAEVVAYRESDMVDEDELAAVLKELAEAETAADERDHVESFHSSEPPATVDSETVQVFDAPVDLAPERAETSSSAIYEDDDADIFTTPQKSGFSLPMPAIAGIAALVVVIAVGAWFVMSGSAEEPKPAAVQAVQVSQPAPATPEPLIDAAQDPITSTTTQPEPASSTVEVQSGQPVAAKAAATPAKPKKAEAAKTEKKKAVTVDDLINDN